jgi:hypothetical protein
MVEVFFMFEDFPKDFSSVLKQNFCAMKYVYTMPDKKRVKLAKEVRKMSPDEMRKCVSELAKHVF